MGLLGGGRGVIPSNTVSGSIYVWLGLAFFVLAMLGGSYLLTPQDAHRPFVMLAEGMITAHEAGGAMLPLCSLAGAALMVFGYRRSRSAEPVPKQHRFILEHQADAPGASAPAVSLGSVAVA